MKKLAAVFCVLASLAPSSRALEPYAHFPRQPPHRGMTKAEAVAYYGEPFRRVVVDGEEQWSYRLKFDEVYGRAWVPFQAESHNIHMGFLCFDKDGKVRRYEWKRTVSRQRTVTAAF